MSTTTLRLVYAWTLLISLVTIANGQEGTLNISCTLLYCDYSYGLFNSNFSCAHSGCETIPVDIPKDVVRVDLRGNLIQSLEATLHDFKNLESLDLSCNQISSIADKALPESLINLNLSCNAITMDVLAGKAFAEANQLEYLNLANNRIENLTIANIFWMKMPKLRLLDLSRNQITAMVHNALTDLRMLESIDLSGNLIKVLETEDFMGLTSLVNLNLSGNQMEAIPDRFFHGLDAIKTLDLSDNLIREISNLSITEVDVLETLHLERNQLRKIPAVMSSYLNRLQFLYLDGNPLETIEPRALPSSLKGISIQKCDSLKEIAEFFGPGANHLTTVAIRDNPKLKTIRETTFGGSDNAVKDLDLSYNALTMLPSTLVNWSNLTSVNLAGNVWDCDCNMAWVKQLSDPSPGFQTLECHNPLHLRSLKAVDVDVSQFSCSVASRYRRQGALALAVFFTVIVLTTLTLVLRKYRHKICPSMYPTGKYETLYSSAEAEADDELSQPVTIKKTGGSCDEPVAV